MIRFFALLLTLTASVNLAAEDEFLLPDQAFRVSGQADGPDAVVVSWDIADGYYMYRSKFKFRSDTVGIEIGNPKSPPAETKTDEFFGEVEIYRDRVDVRLPVKRAAGAGEVLALETTSQGCADQGLCYPPHKQQILLELPKLAATAPEAKPDPKPESALEPEGGAEQPALGALADLSQSLGLGAMDDDVLQPEEAFQLTAEVAAPDRLQLTWNIADGTYLYQEKIAVSLEDAENVALGAFQLPEAEIKQDTVRPDGTIGDIAVYHNRIDLPLPLLRASTEPTSVTLVAKYQGCAERGICYPPQTQRMKLELPAALAVSAVAGRPPAESTRRPAVRRAPRSRRRRNPSPRRTRSPRPWPAATSGR